MYKKDPEAVLVASRADEGQMGQRTFTVFSQADALWRPESVALRRAFEDSRGVIDRDFNARGMYPSGNRIAAHAQEARTDLGARSTKILEVLFRAHKIRANIRSNAYSPGTFCAWHNARLDEEADQMRGNPPLVGGRFELTGEYLKAFAPAIELEKDRASARIRQHFASDTEWWLWHYAKMLGHLKAIPGWMWAAIAGWAVAIVAIFNPGLAATLRSLLPHFS